MGRDPLGVRRLLAVCLAYIDLISRAAAAVSGRSHARVSSSAPRSCSAKYQTP